MKKVMMTLMAVVFAIAANAQYNTNYYDQYGKSGDFGHLWVVRDRPQILSYLLRTRRTGNL